MASCLRPPALVAGRPAKHAAQAKCGRTWPAPDIGVLQIGRAEVRQACPSRGAAAAQQAGQQAVQQLRAHRWRLVLQQRLDAGHLQPQRGGEQG